MRFAVLANIQANLFALRAILADIERLDDEVDRIISLGDLIGRGPFPNEVLETCRERDVEMLLGNYDDAVAFERLGSGADFPSGQEEQEDRAAVTWTRRKLTPENLETLQHLPRDVRIYAARRGSRLKRNAGDVRPAEMQRTFLTRLAFGSLLRDRPNPTAKRIKEVLLVHGSPRALNEFLREDTADSIAAKVAEEARADLIVSGHNGTCFRKIVGQTTFVGPGSVSGSYGTPGRAEYAILEVGGDLDVDFRSTRYDSGLMLAAMHKHALPLHPAGL